MSEPAISRKLEQLSGVLGRKASVTDQIADLLRGMIISGDLKPGERIVESRLARQLGVGQPTVREALVKLEHQGLVVRRANQSCTVTALSTSEISQILPIRRDLETLAVELAVVNASDADVHKLIALTGLMKSAALAQDVAEFFAHDLHFHETLWQLSGNAFLPRLLSQLMLPLLAFLFLRNLRNHPRFDLVASAEAHLGIAEAILSRDKQAAREVALEKFQMFADQHLNLLEKTQTGTG